MKVLPVPQPKFLTQGGYGCVFHPGVSCKEDGLLTDKYITKIQSGKYTSSREIVIGEKIKKIKNYADYYAPILSSCSVSLSNVSDSEIKKCDIIKSDALTYAASKLTYVGKNTLLKHLLAKYTAKPIGINREIVSTHKALLDGFKRLSDAGIIHYDVKDNNVMCEDKTGTPIIIDFGLSIDVSEISANDYKDAFYVYGPDYGPWCLEIAMISYAANEVKPEDPVMAGGYVGFGGAAEPIKWTEMEVKKEHIDRVVGDFIKKNDAFADLIVDVQREKYRVSMTQYYSKYVGKQWKEMVVELQTHIKSWDNYGLSVCYLYIIKQLKLDNASLMKSYKSYLEEIVLSAPSDRPSCDQTMAKLNELFGKVKKNEQKKQQKDILNKLRNPAVQAEVKTNVWASIKRQLLIDEKMKQQRQAVYA
jgi:serine/threonine protein kinase